MCLCRVYLKHFYTLNLDIYGLHCCPCPEVTGPSDEVRTVNFQNFNKRKTKLLISFQKRKVLDTNDQTDTTNLVKLKSFLHHITRGKGMKIPIVLKFTYKVIWISCLLIYLEKLT